MTLNLNTIILTLMLTIAALVLFTNTGFDVALSIISTCLDALFNSVQTLSQT